MSQNCPHLEGFNGHGHSYVDKYIHAAYQPFKCDRLIEMPLEFIHNMIMCMDDIVLQYRYIHDQSLPITDNNKITPQVAQQVLLKQTHASTKLLTASLTPAHKHANT